MKLRTPPSQTWHFVKIDVYADEHVALNRIYDITVEGSKIEEQLEFGSLLKAYLEEHGEELSESFTEAFNNISNQSNVTAYIKGGEGKWAVLKGSADQVAVNTSNLLNGDTTVLTSEGSSVLPASEEPETAKSQNYFQRSIKQVFLGNYSDDVTVMGTGMQIALGIINADMPADIRDIVYDIQNWEWSKGHISKTLLDGIGFIPVIGAIKYGDEVSVLIRAGNNGEVAKLTGRINNAVLDTISKERKEIGNVMDGVQDGVGNTIIKGWEKNIGHVLEKHVGLSDAELLKRLETEPLISAASTFTDKQTAWNVIAETINSNADEIAQWEKSAKPWATRDFYFNGTQLIGRGVSKTEPTIYSMSNAVVRLKKLENGGWALYSSYPIH